MTNKQLYIALLVILILFVAGMAVVADQAKIYEDNIIYTYEIEGSN